MRPIMIMAGGTGGHVFPALAVAKELRAFNVPVVWVGTERGLESRVVPAAGFTLVKMQVQGLRRKGLSQYLRAPFIILRALWESMRIMIRYQPAALLGMGGFVAGPCALMGFLMRKPLIIHEQNAVVGLTNRILAPLSKVMFTGFPVSLKHRDRRWVGNPVREELHAIDAPEKRLAVRDESKKILIIGGSQGSAALNSKVPEAVSKLAASLQVEVWHQTGVRELDKVTKSYQQHTCQVKVSAFIESMEEAYAWADLVICRSGAMTLAELATVGVGSVLVPYPYAVDDHQTKNASAFVERGAAYLLPEKNLQVQQLADLLKSLLSDEKKLLEMAQAAKQLANQNAGKTVAQTCMQLAGYDLAANPS